MIAVAHLQARPDYSGFSVFSDSDLERHSVRGGGLSVCAILRVNWERRVSGSVLALESQSYARSSVVTKWMGDRYVPGFAPVLRFLQSKFCADSTKVLRTDYKPRSPVCIRMQKDHIRTLKIL